MNKKTIILLAALMCVMPLCSHAQKTRAAKKEINKTLSEFRSAFAAKDMAALGATLSEDFSISVMNMPGAVSYLQPLMNASGLITDIEFVAVDSQDDTGVLADVIFRGSNNPDGGVSKMKFDNNYKIIFADYLDRAFGSSRYNASRLVARIPIELEGRSIIVPLKINGSDRVCRFLFDSGADAMAIRASLADSLGLQANGTMGAQIVGGSMTLSQSMGNTVHLGEHFSLANQSLTLFPTVRHGLDGLIGLNLCRQYITKVDLNRKEMLLYSFGDYDYGSSGVVIPVKIPNIIEIPINIDLTGAGDVQGNFVFDTGANFDIIAFTQFVAEAKLLEQGWVPRYQSTTISMGHETPTLMGTATKVTIAPGITYNSLPITLQVPSENQNTVEGQPDGSVGAQIIGDFNFTIDMLRKQIHLVWR